MDIDHPDPGTSPQFNFLVEAPVDAETLTFAAPNGTATVEATPPAHCSGEHEASTRSESTDAKERSEHGERMDEDTQANSVPANSDNMKDGTGLPAFGNGTQDTKNEGSRASQDALMTDQSDYQPSLPRDQSFTQSATSSSTTTLQDSSDTTMSDGSAISDGQESRTPSGEARSSDSSLGGSDSAEGSGTVEEKRHISGQTRATSTSLYSSYLPPQPYGCSPYPPVAEATALSDGASTKPLPPSPTITYASTEDLGEPNQMDVDANAGFDSTSPSTHLPNGVDPINDTASQQAGTGQHSNDQAGSAQGPEHPAENAGQPPFTHGPIGDLANSFTIPSGQEPFSQGPPLSSFASQVPFGHYDSGTGDSPDQNHLDLLPRVKGLFRLLDLYSETTNSGLVDKIIISQASLGEFINTILPGAYTNVTKIDFNRLDREARLPLIGIYGSKSEIIRFLQAAGSIDDDVAGLLQLPDDISIRTRPVLRSGIYMLDPPNNQSEIESGPPTRYVIYWPENTTWDDHSSGSVRKNRVTFMRYLTCLTDQIRCLISSEHEKMLVFDNGGDDEDSDDEAFESTWGDQDDGKVNDRFFKFEVAKTNEQEEDARIGQGFKIEHQTLTCSRAPHPSGRSLSLEPRLLAGETVQAFSTLRFNEGVHREVRLDGHYNPYYLKSMLGKYSSIVISETIEEADLGLLLDKGGLEHRLPPGMSKSYKKTLDDVRASCDAEEKKNVAQCLQNAKENQPRLQSQVRLFIIYRLLDTYSHLEWEMIAPGESQPGSNNVGDPLDYFNFICAASPLVKEALDTSIKEAKLGVINFEAYRRLKRPFLIVRNILDHHANLTDEQRDILVHAISQEDLTLTTSGSSNTGWKKFNPLHWGKAVVQKLGITNEDETEALIKLYSQVDDEPDPQFLSSLADVEKRHRRLSDCAYRLKSSARDGLLQRLGKLADTLVQKLSLAYERQIKQQCDLQAKSSKQNQNLEAFAKYRGEVQSILAGNQAGHTLHISWIKPRQQWAYSHEVDIKATTRQHLEPTITVGLWVLDLTEDDKQRVRDDLGFVPTPRIPSRPQLEQQIPLNWTIRRVQMLGPKKCLLVIDGPDKTRIWIFSPHAGLNLDAPNYHIASLSGKDYVIAVDEHKKVLAFVISGSASCVLQQYLIDIESSTVHGRGSPFNLVPWYDHAVPKISHAAFFSGTDDLCLVESSGKIRILSIAQQNFRPATIQLEGCPLFVRSSPDGSALLVLEGTRGAPRTLRVFHHASFGSKPLGIDIPLPDSFDGVQSFSITSIGERGRVFILGLDPSAHTIVSVNVDISRKETEYQFRAKQDGQRPHPTQASSANNTLITCFSEVWERFPVMAAIQRETISPGTRNPSSSLTFICDSPNLPFSSYFRRMIRAFEETAKKPTGQRLASIQVSSSTFDETEWEMPPTSNFKAGEWIVELLCLIPIHIAVADENRFVPLKDGVRDHAVERELLGAEVSRIIDSISLGWYESIFSVYMASKRVKVISSMGEQSVGKSYSLNHMVDSSFAGSAVRTTEGVWLSVCPTREFLVVALDFEGVHSIERTPQEDMLLVLFNTALSNLIIFRNNFALSRDVANMFTSFQASTHLFDPKSNPKLFKGLLAIVIKDVVDADKKDIVKEFSSKFGQIVSKEQASNFITVLHDSQLTVIPWSVILSPDFYRLFGKLGKTLFNQKTTHDSAGEFLITLKTLMAKMKAQDWGSLDHTVIKHRVTAITALLPNVLAFGRLGPEADGEELRNMDNQIPIITNDTSTVFYLGKDETERAAALSCLVKDWNPNAARQSSSELVQHLQDVAERRISTARKWMQENIARFPEDNADMRALKRRFEDLSDTLQANIQLCLAECALCRLRCMSNRSHGNQDHDCGTSHRCIDLCDYSDDHDSEECCGLPAGHGGRHICDPSSHLCGEPCHLNSRKGCQGHCMRQSGEEHSEHTCAAQVHLCGEPCDLRDTLLADGSRFSCNLLCTLPYNEDHGRHVCDNRLSCPITCELCSRLCSMGDHFHGMGGDSLHLCGQTHPCGHQCAAAGICEIVPAPHSVETNFDGRHSKFAYTKYTQVAKRLDCAIVIPSGQRLHPGPHVHSTQPNPFHHCETRCLNCGYFCTLPLGHPQAEHDTAHGSMELTAWAVEGNADAVVEVQGRKFAAQETGAPQLCSSICRNLGRHAHIDYCRNEKGGECREAESEHITTRMLPNLDRPKDWISHREFWARTGFVDPYSNDEQADFALCNVQCAGPEHEPPARPSYCKLPIFHSPKLPDWSAPGNDSYISNDGHEFGCPNPNNLRQAFHVIFVLDRSGSMGGRDRTPLPGQPVTATISQHNNNRFGAVLSALYGFWISRGSGNQGRRDAYSVILFESSAQVQIANDLNSTPEQLLNLIVRERIRGGTNFDGALSEARSMMETHWSTERSPVVIFLSDGECGVSDNVIHDICNRAVARGKPLSFHSVSFGNSARSASLRRMVTIAEQVAAAAPPNPLNPLVPCGYTDVMDTIRLAETFLNIADSLKKPRAALLRS